MDTDYHNNNYYIYNKLVQWDQGILKQETKDDDIVIKLESDCTKIECIDLEYNVFNIYNN